MNNLDDMINTLPWERMSKDNARAVKVMIELAKCADQKVTEDGDNAFKGKDFVETLVLVNAMTLDFFINSMGPDEEDPNIAYLINGTLVALSGAMEKMNKPTRKLVKRSMRDLQKKAGFVLADFT